MKQFAALLITVVMAIGSLVAFSAPSFSARGYPDAGCRCIATVTKATGPFRSTPNRSVDMRISTTDPKHPHLRPLPKGRWVVQLYKRGKGKIRTVTQVVRGKTRTVATGKMWRGRYRAVINYLPGPYGPHAPSRTVKFFNVR